MTRHSPGVVRLLCLALVASALPLAASQAACLKDRDNEVICGRGECDRDRRGRVLCSAFQFGGVLRTRAGDILCGRGACAKDFDGDVYCSTVEGGAVLIDTDGRVRCEGRCEPGSVELCEAEIAGGSPDRGGLLRSLRLPRR